MLKEWQKLAWGVGGERSQTMAWTFCSCTEHLHGHASSFIGRLISFIFSILERPCQGVSTGRKAVNGRAQPLTSSEILSVNVQISGNAAYCRTASWEAKIRQADMQQAGADCP